jgi:hypothetical protein
VLRNITAFGRLYGYLRQFLNDDHFPMTTYRLHPKEKDDVSEFSPIEEKPSSE